MAFASCSATRVARVIVSNPACRKTITRREEQMQSTTTAPSDGHKLSSVENTSIELQRLRRMASLLDSAFRIPGTEFRIGWDTILGLIPGVGDVATGLASASIVGYAARKGVRRRVIARMLANVGIDVLVGAIPVLGDVFDAGFKANLRNVKLLERELSARKETM